MSQTPPTANEPGVRRFAIAPADSAYRLYTVLIVAALLAACGGAVFFAVATTGWVRVLALLAGLVIFAGTLTVLALTWLYARPECFEVSPEGLKVVWPGRTRKLPRGAFAELEVLSAITMGRCTRVFGVGGLFGSFGRHRSEYLGNLDLYITRTDRMVLLRLKNRRSIVLSPAEPDAFLAAMRELLGQAETSAPRVN